MPYYVEKNGTKYEIGAAGSDVACDYVHCNDLKLNTGVTLPMAGFKGASTTDRFVKYQKGKAAFLLGDYGMNGICSVLWGNAPTMSTNYYVASADESPTKLLAGRRNCPIPVRASGTLNNAFDLSTSSNAGSSGFFHFCEMSPWFLYEGNEDNKQIHNSDLPTQITITYDHPNFLITDDKGVSRLNVAQQALLNESGKILILDIQAAGGESGYGGGGDGALGIGGGHYGGCGGGGGAFCTLLIDYSTLDCQVDIGYTQALKIINTYDGIKLKCTIGTSEVTLLIVEHGKKASKGSTSSIYGDDPHCGTAGIGGTVITSKYATPAYGIYILDDAPGAAGGLGEVICGGYWGGDITQHDNATRGGSNGHYFAPGPLDDTISTRTLGGSTGGVSSSYAYANGGGGGASVCGSGLNGTPANGTKDTPTVQNHLGGGAGGGYGKGSGGGNRSIAGSAGIAIYV